MKVDRITHSTHSKFSKLAGGRLLDLVQPEADPFDPLFSKTTPEWNSKSIGRPVAEISLFEIWILYRQLFQK